MKQSLLIPTPPLNNMDRKAEILRCLINQDLTTGEIAKRLGFEEGYNKVDAHLKELEKEGFLESETIKAGKGRPPRLYRIKRELEVVERIYEGFPDLRDVLRESDWVLELLEEKIKKESYADRFPVKEMLKCSSEFFKICLKGDVFSLAERWVDHILIDVDDLVGERYTQWEGQFRDDNLKKARRLQWVFASCVFMDCQNTAREEVFKLLGEMRAQLRKYSSNVLVV